MVLLVELSARLASATGADHALDDAVARTFGTPRDDYTSSVEACRRLVAAVLPGWRIHIGFGVTGIVPYAVVSSGPERFDNEAPTVPLAILRAVAKALERRR